MQLPSKELLSEVLGKDYNDRFVDWFQIEDDNYLRTYYDCGKFDEQGRPTGLGIEINIYELAHKCKEWAVKQGYKIRIDAHDYMENDSFSGTYWWVNRLRPKTWQEEGCPNCGANSTEPEAIFAACKWILDNKDN